MKHPTEEQWMEYLYGELADTGELARHVEDCATCRAKLTEYKEVLRALDHWKVEPRPAFRRPSWQPLARWAAAAALLISTAFATARVSQPEVDLGALQAELGGQIEQKLRQEFHARLQSELTAARQQMEQQLTSKLAEHANQSRAASREQLDQLALALATLRQEDRTALSAALDRIEAQRAADFRSLREDLEKVAVYTDTHFRNAQRQFVQLASLKEQPKE